MLPIATGPNAIAYATGRVSTASMRRAGFIRSRTSPGHA